MDHDTQVTYQIDTGNKRVILATIEKDHQESVEVLNRTLILICTKRLSFSNIFNIISDTVMEK